MTKALEDAGLTARARREMGRGQGGKVGAGVRRTFSSPFIDEIG
jgi:hypothetical protein